MRDKDGFIIKCKYSDWQIVDAQDNYDDVCLFYPYYHNLKCYADERCAHYVPDRTEREDAPSVTQKLEKWINDKDDMPTCSKCGYIPPYSAVIDDYEYSNYCPNCGAKMESEDKE